MTEAGKHGHGEEQNGRLFFVFKKKQIETELLEMKIILSETKNILNRLTADFML